MLEGQNKYPELRHSMPFELWIVQFLEPYFLLSLYNSQINDQLALDLEKRAKKETQLHIEFLLL